MRRVCRWVRSGWLEPTAARCTAPVRRPLLAPFGSGRYTAGRMRIWDVHPRLSGPPATAWRAPGTAWSGRRPWRPQGLFRAPGNPALDRLRLGAQAAPPGIGGRNEPAGLPGTHAGADAIRAGRWPRTFIDRPGTQFELLAGKQADGPGGRIPLPASTQQLWAQHKYSVMARSQRAYRELGRRVSGLGGRDGFDAIAGELVEWLRAPPAAWRVGERAQPHARLPARALESACQPAGDARHHPAAPQDDAGAVSWGADRSDRLGGVAVAAVGGARVKPSRVCIGADGHGTALSAAPALCYCTQRDVGVLV